MIDVSVADVGKVLVPVPDEFEHDQLEKFIFTLEWAMSYGYVDSFYTPDGIRKMVEESNQEPEEDDGLWLPEPSGKEDVAWLADVDSMFIINDDIVPWINENLPIGFFATYDPRTGIVLNKKED